MQKMIIFFVLYMCVLFGMKENIQELSLESRFLLSTDYTIFTVAGIPLRSSWWSRPYEYAWALQFMGNNAVVLDAACGISHPFKWLLGKQCKEAWACDWDIRIAHKDQILQETMDDLGLTAYEVLAFNPDLHKKVHLVHSSITNLPENMPLFDRIFCISTLEYMSKEERKKALKEFCIKLAPKGLIIITVDYPTVTPEELLQAAREAGLTPAGEVKLGKPPKNAIHDQGLYIYCCVLKSSVYLISIDIVDCSHIFLLDLVFYIVYIL
jgi:SAM-dependent methyltransferase